jgi:hypothetical protein
MLTTILEIKNMNQKNEVLLEIQNDFVEYEKEVLRLGREKN